MIRGVQPTDGGRRRPGARGSDASRLARARGAARRAATAAVENGAGRTAGAGGPATGPSAQGLEDEAGQEKPTRERILDIALDLFIEKGFDKTSLREIAERLGFSKAALYYHFASKEDILMALHLRLHELGRVAVDRLGSEPASREAWRGLLYDMVGDMLANRKIFVMHQRNQAAFEHLHREGHEEAHEDLEELFRRALADPSAPVRDRVRLACALGAVVTSLVLAGGMFDDVPSDTLGNLLREAVGDLLGPAAGGAPDRAAGAGARRNGRGGSGRVRTHERS